MFDMVLDEEEPKQKEYSGYLSLNAYNMRVEELEYCINCTLDMCVHDLRSSNDPRHTQSLVATYEAKCQLVIHGLTPAVTVKGAIARKEYIAKEREGNIGKQKKKRPKHMRGRKKSNIFRPYKHITQKIIAGVEQIPDNGVVSYSALARICKVDKATIKSWVMHGVIKKSDDGRIYRQDVEAQLLKVQQGAS